MGWFLMPEPETTGDALSCLATVHRAAGGKAAGGGVLLDARSVLTCAHVVNDALGRSLFEPRTPGPDELRLSVWGKHGRVACAARVAHWIPPRPVSGSGAVREGAREWLGDLAVLRFEVEPGPDKGPQRFAPRLPMEPGRSVRSWHGSGNASTFATMRVEHVDGAVGYFDGSPTGMAVGRGYSGGPVWSTSDRAVVGVLIGHFMPPDGDGPDPAPHSPQHLIRRSWGMPWQQVEAELRAVGALAQGAGGVPAADDDAGADDPARQLLVETLREVLPWGTSLSDHANRLARDLGAKGASEVTPPSAEDFADFLLTHPRALAHFTETIRRSDPAAVDRLLAAGRLSPVPLLLSPGEYDQLHRLLRDTDRSVRVRFAEAARAALPLTASFPVVGDERRAPGDGDGGAPIDGDGSAGGGPGAAGGIGSARGVGSAGGMGAVGRVQTLDELIDRLERLHGDGRSDDGPRVPALLRFVEYLGVLCTAPQYARLRMWSGRVASRLGIPHSALAERRGDAQDWGRSLRDRTGRVRVLVQVTPSGRDRYGLRIWCDEGAGPRQVSAASTGSYSGPEGARELLRVLESLDPAAVAAQRPLVEVLVDRAGLNLPIDEWEGMGPGEIVPGVLGAEFPLVVHCPELLRRHERFLPDWRRRWQQLDSGTTLVFSDDGLDTRAIYATLMDRLDAVRVSVDVPAGLRDDIVQVCLAVGVPVVVWDRERGDASHAVGEMADVATRELPDGVRSYRAKTMQRPREYTGRPVLAWADADRTIPRLHLSEPAEGA
ncbi:trypsin-like peptidase domain-containing protein [Streptomyces sp. NPDC047315]|uniref:VMAP-C domain-containing protein n=1 Tax=Streptomyces sp. NPDC047315 TaxID=3155142 RepID=UPI0033DAC9E3